LLKERGGRINRWKKDSGGTFFLIKQREQFYGTYQPVPYKKKGYQYKSDTVYK
jgi:hypothetical protein